MVLVSPAFHWFISVTSYTPVRCLQGKSAGARGELLRELKPYGTGYFILMCADALAARAKRAMALENMLTVERL
jgi:hypothetical protein